MSEAIAIMPRNYPATADIISSFSAYCSVKDSTLKGYIVCLKAFARWAQEQNIQQPTRADIREYVRFLDESNLKPGTKTQYLRAVKQLFQWASAEQLYPFDISQGIKGTWKVDRQHHKKDPLWHDDVVAVCKSIDNSTEQGKRLLAMFLLGTVGGFRTIEMSRLNVDDVKTIGNETYVYIWGKGHSEPDTQALLAKEVADAIKDYLSSRTDKPTGKSPLFVSTSNRSQGKRISTTTISTILKTMLKNAGYDSDRLTAHSLRHASGTAAKSAGLDLYGVQHHLRHMNPETSEIYIHTIEEHTSNSQQIIYDYFFKDNEENSPRQEAVTIVQSLPIDKLEKLLPMLRALQ